MKLWGGRFEGPVDELMERFNASIGFDWRLYAADTEGSIAYARALEKARLLTEDERDRLLAGLRAVNQEFEDGIFQINPSDEDIHTAVERRLGEMVGEVAGKLHAGRSRNDQVATDLRLYMMWEIPGLRRQLGDLQAAFLDKAQQHLEVIMPGYTHLQRAQPVLFSHWLMSYFWMLQRDQERLRDLERRVAVLPLGSGALAGNALSIDRDFLAAELGFPSVSENSLDSVSDRDFVVEFLFWAALLQVHLSRMAEDLIIWSTAEFGFVELDDAYSTGSSLMPQKKNPDSLELLRGKTGRMLGHLVALMTVLKGLPSAYNKDMQEDKEPLFDALDTLKLALAVASGVVRTLKINSEAMAAALDDAMLATDLADYMVRKGVPFRQSHGLVGQAVRKAEAMGCPLRELPLSEFRALSSVFEEDLRDVFDCRRSVETRNLQGGTGSTAVRRQIERAALALGEIRAGATQKRQGAGPVPAEHDPVE